MHPSSGPARSSVYFLRERYAGALMVIPAKGARACAPPTEHAARIERRKAREREGRGGRRKRETEMPAARPAAREDKEIYRAIQCLFILPRPFLARERYATALPDALFSPHFFTLFPPPFLYSRPE